MKKEIELTASKSIYESWREKGGGFTSMFNGHLFNAFNAGNKTQQDKLKVAFPELFLP